MPNSISAASASIPFNQIPQPEEQDPHAENPGKNRAEQTPADLESEHRDVSQQAQLDRRQFEQKHVIKPDARSSAAASALPAPYQYKTPPGRPQALTEIMQMQPGMTPDDAEKLLQQLEQSESDINRDIKTLSEASPDAADSFLFNTMSRLSSAGKTEAGKLLLPGGEIAVKHLKDPAYAAALKELSTTEGINMVSRFLGAARGTPVSHTEARMKWAELQQIEVQVASAKLSRAQTEGTLVKFGVGAGAVAGAMFLAPELAAAGGLARATGLGASALKNIGEHMASQFTRTAGESALRTTTRLASGAVGVSSAAFVASDLYHGEYKQALLDGVLGISVGAGVLGKVASAYTKQAGEVAAKVFGQECVNTLEKSLDYAAGKLTAGKLSANQVFSGSTQVATGYVPAVNRIAQSMGVDPLGELSNMYKKIPIGNEYTKFGLDALNIGMTIGSIADPKRAALWAGTNGLASFLRGDFKSANGTVDTIGFISFKKGIAMPHALELAEGARKAFLTTVMSSKLPAVYNSGEDAYFQYLRDQQLAVQDLCERHIARGGYFADAFGPIIDQSNEPACREQ